jgi:Ca2+-binding RTX toxin-like protein
LSITDGASFNVSGVSGVEIVDLTVASTASITLGSSGIGSITGAAATDQTITMVGGVSALTVDLGAAGADTLTLANANNTVTVVNIETVTGGTLNDTITASGTQAVNMVGGTGTDSLSGSSGNDILQGGAGNDTLTGGTGDDTIVFGGAIGASAAGSIARVTTLGVDSVVGFNAQAGDTFRFSEAAFGNLNGAVGEAALDQAQVILLSSTASLLNTTNAQIDGAGDIAATAGNGVFVVVGSNVAGETVSLYFVRSGADVGISLADSVAIGEAVKIADVQLTGVLVIGDFAGGP